MERTTNYNLKKPAGNESARITDINENMDKIDTELKRVELISNTKVNTTDKATITDAEVGTNDTKWMTPLKTMESILSLFGSLLATRTDAVAGTANDKIMTPLRVNDVTGKLSALQTTNKTNLAAAINEVENDVTQHLEQTASTMQKGHVQLTSATNSDSETLGATAKAVKTAYDRAEQAFTQANNGKELIATAIIGKNGTASSSDSFQQLASAIGGLGGATLDVVYTGTAQIISTTFSYSTHSIPDIGNIDDCFVMIRGAYDFPASSGFGAETCTIEIMSSTSIRIQRGGAYAYASSKYIYDIIRVSGLKSFQKGTYIPSGNSYSFTSPSSIPITPVNKNKSVLLFNLRTSTTNPEPKQLIPLLRINDDGNAILFNGYSGMTINYTILEFE